MIYQFWQKKRPNKSIISNNKFFIISWYVQDLINSVKLNYGQPFHPRKKCYPVTWIKRIQIEKEFDDVCIRNRKYQVTCYTQGHKSTGEKCVTSNDLETQLQTKRTKIV